MPARRTRGRTFFSAVGLRRPKAKKKTTPIPAKPQKAKSALASKAKRAKHQDFEKGLVFVAMSFQGERNTQIFAALKEACLELKLHAKRVDENYMAGIILLEIVDMIEQAEFIIFDLTFERPNVYYELGYAHGVGNDASNILLIAKTGTKIHFDIGGLRVQHYRSIKDLQRIVKLALGGAIKDTRK